MKMINTKTFKKGKSSNLYLKKMINLCYLICPFIIILFFWKAKNNAEIFELNKCNIEKKISFNGVISNYKTNILAEQSSFYINDSIKITIPRNSKELFLIDGDSITKTKGNNIYIVKSNKLLNNEFKKTIDTVNFKYHK